MARNGKEILVYSIAKQEEVEEVAHFAEETYFSSSPVREIYSSDDVTITKEERLAWTRNRYQNCIQHPTSILVTVREKSTGRLVAFQSLTMRIRGESSAAIWVDPNDRSTGWLLRAILAKLQGGADLYALYKTDRILHLGNASVRRDYQGQKLIGMRNATCRALFAKIAHANQIGAMMVEGINHYAASEKCWQLVHTFHFETFQLPDGTRPLAEVDLGVHRTARLLACRPPPLLTLFHQQSDAAMKSLLKSKM